MRHLILMSFIIVLGANMALAVDYERLLMAGNKHYEQGEFDLAINEYEKIIAADGVSTAVHYNLGCAYFNQKDYGKAILHFEKARQLSPRDADVKHNLEFSKLFLKDRFDLPQAMPFVIWFNQARQSLSLLELKALELTLFILFVIGIVLYRLFRDSQIGRYILLFTGFTGILFLLAAGWLWDRTITLGDKHAVLLVKEAHISSAPVPGSSTLFVIHEGTASEILDATDDWYEIKLADGKTGWIMHEAVGVY